MKKAIILIALLAIGLFLLEGCCFTNTNTKFNGGVSSDSTGEKIISQVSDRPNAFGFRRTGGTDDYKNFRLPDAIHELSGKMVAITITKVWCENDLIRVGINGSVWYMDVDHKRDSIYFHSNKKDTLSLDAFCLFARYMNLHADSILNVKKIADSLAAKNAKILAEKNLAKERKKNIAEKREAERKRKIAEEKAQVKLFEKINAGTKDLNLVKKYEDMLKKQNKISGKHSVVEIFVDSVRYTENGYFLTKDGRKTLKEFAPIWIEALKRKE